MENILDRYPNVVCPTCKISGLKVKAEEIMCKACGTKYELLDGKYPILIPPNVEVSHDEILVQDNVAINYENLRYHNPWARAYHKWWIHLMISQVDVTGRILDNGCGTGILFECLPGANIIGLDLSNKMIRVAGTKSQRVLVGDSQQIPFSDESFDTIFARSLLHHLHDFRKGILEMTRVLCTGGEIISVDTNKSIFSTLPRRIFYKKEHFSNEHENFHRLELMEAFSQHLTIEHVIFFGYIAYPILAFPDIVNIFRFFPFRKTSYKLLMKIDSLLARIPGIGSQAWALLIKARKR